MTTVEDPLKGHYPIGNVFKVIKPIDEKDAPSYVPEPCSVDEGLRGVVRARKEIESGERWLSIKIFKSEISGWVPMRKLQIYNKPIGYPCRAQRDFYASAILPSASPVQPQLRIEVGTVALIMDVKRIQVLPGYPEAEWFRLVTHEKREDGWVPSSILQVGPRPIHDLVIGDNVPDVSVADQLELPTTDKGVLHSSIVCTMHIWRFQNSTIGLAALDDRMRLFLPTKESIYTYADLIVAGVKRAGILDVLNSDEFTLREMESAARYKISTEEKKDEISGVYCIRYSFAHKSQDKFYIGISSNMRRRLTQHEKNAKDPDMRSPHYKAARLAKSHCMFAVCRFEMGQDDTVMRPLSEQMLISLLQAYTSTVLQVGEGQQLAHLIHDPAMQQEQYGSAVLAARRFSLVTEIVSQRTGWPMTLSRKKRFPEKTSFGANDGLNWESELLAPGENLVIWTRTEIPNLVVNFRRRAVRLLARASEANVEGADHDTRLRVDVFGGRTPDMMNYGKVSLPDIENLDLVGGAKVHIVVEIRLDGKPHPYAWAHLPTVGPFTDWHVANTVGIKIQWLSATTSKWHELFLASSRRLLYNDDAPPGGLHQYLWAMTVRRHLLQENMSNPFPWQHPWPTARVFQVGFDVLNQKVNMMWRENVKEVPQPGHLSLREVQDILENLGAESFTHPSERSDAKQSFGRPRIACDACTLKQRTFGGKWEGRKVLDTSSGIVICPKIPGDPPWCKQCKLFGRPCSWTALNKLASSEELVRAFVFLQDGPNPLRTIEAPEIHSRAFQV